MYERNPRYTNAPIWDHTVGAPPATTGVAFSTNIGTTAGLGTAAGPSLGGRIWSYSVIGTAVANAFVPRRNGRRRPNNTSL